MLIPLLTGSPPGNLIISSFMTSIVNNSILFTIPIYSQTVLLDSATISGLSLLSPMSAPPSRSLQSASSSTGRSGLNNLGVLGAAFVFAEYCCLTAMQRGFKDRMYFVTLVPFSAYQGIHYPSTFMMVQNVLVLFIGWYMERRETEMVCEVFPFPVLSDSVADSHF
jgi:hypothetical protein